MSHALRFALFTALIAVSLDASAESFIRRNAAGYAPEDPKKVLVMSDGDLEGQSWELMDGAEEITSGTFGASLVGMGAHTPFEFNHSLDLSDVNVGGELSLELQDGTAATITIKAAPLNDFTHTVLRHLRVARSGTDTALFHAPSHMGDAQAIVHVLEGERTEANWVPSAGGETLDMLGGWYDAGDYVKYTLTTGYTAYFLLRAYEANPGVFIQEYSPDVVDILDEARHGLDYLMKTHPSDDIFVIQTSSHLDHLQGSRLPEDDARDGQREALVALSVPQMAYAAAALALGARVFGPIDSDRALAYGHMSEKIFARMRQQDVNVISAFDANGVNELYRDETNADNVALAAIELHLLTGEQSYLDIALAERPVGIGGWNSWGAVNLQANQRIGLLDAAAREDARAELEFFVNQAGANVWDLPQIYTWASLSGWVSIAAEAAENAQSDSPLDGTAELAQGILDYLFGKNSWGVSFVADQRLENTVHNIFNKIYLLTGEFPRGAISGGPGAKSIHDTVRKWFPGPLDTSLEKFNTDVAVFYDDSDDFQCQETLIIGQAVATHLLAVASRTETSTGAVLWGGVDWKANQGTDNPVVEDPDGHATAEPGSEPNDEAFAQDSSGCGCKTVPSPSRNSGLLAASAIALLLSRRRRRVTGSSPSI